MKKKIDYSKVEITTEDVIKWKKSLSKTNVRDMRLYVVGDENVCKAFMKQFNKILIEEAQKLLKKKKK